MGIISKTNIHLKAPHQLTNRVGRFNHRLKRMRDKIVGHRRHESGSFGGIQQENTRENLRWINRFMEHYVFADSLLLH
jgi:hypothetical protein